MSKRLVMAYHRKPGPDRCSSCRGAGTVTAWPDSHDCPMRHHDCDCSSSEEQCADCLGSGLVCAECGEAPATTEAKTCRACLDYRREKEAAQAEDHEGGLREDARIEANHA